MTTNIRIQVKDGGLIRQVKNAQIANRKSLVNQESDQKFLADVKARKAAQVNEQAVVTRDGAVPEYGISPQTSAQRGGLGFGWVYETYEDIIEQSYVAANDAVNKYRIAVGSGNGASWQYAEVQLAAPANARDVILATAQEPYFYGSTTLDYPVSSYGAPSGQIFQECQGVAAPIITFKRQYVNNDRYLSDRPLVGSFILPVSPDQCVLVGSMVLRWSVLKEYTGPNETIELPENWLIIGGRIFGPPGPKTFYDSLGNPIPVEDGRCGWLIPTYTDDLFPPRRIPSEFVTHGIARTDFAFLISSTKVVKLEVGDLLKDRLESVFPTPKLNSNGWDIDYWPNTDYSALGVSFDVATSSWGPVVTGAPSIFDILDNDNDFTLYASTGPNSKGQSAYASVVPRFSPDSILDVGESITTEVPNIYSAFYFGRRISAIPVVPPNPPSYSGENVYLSEYVYLNIEQRAASDYYLYSTSEAKEILDTKLEADPSFAFMSISNPPDGVYEDSSYPEIIWYPTTGFRRDRRVIRLLPSRTLPPALFSSALTPHPLIKKQRTFYPQVGTYYFTSPAYSRFKFKTLFWSAWGRNWRSKVQAYGVSFAVAE